MKARFWMLAAALLAQGVGMSVAVAQSAAEGAVAQQALLSRPVLMFVKRDGATGGVQLGDGMRLSRSAHDKLCWVAQDFPPNAQLGVEQKVQGPAPFTLQAGGGAKVTPVNGGAAYLVHQQVQTSAEGFASTCVTFDETDPLGMYTDRVTVGGQTAETRLEVVQ